MTDKEYAADCIEFLRALAERFRLREKTDIEQEIADRLEEIACSLQVDTQEDA